MFSTWQINHDNYIFTWPIIVLLNQAEQWGCLKIIILFKWSACIAWFLLVRNFEAPWWFSNRSLPSLWFSANILPCPAVEVWTSPAHSNTASYGYVGSKDVGEINLGFVCLTDWFCFFFRAPFVPLLLFTEKKKAKIYQREAKYTEILENSQ